MGVINQCSRMFILLLNIILFCRYRMKYLEIDNPNKVKKSARRTKKNFNFHFFFFFLSHGSCVYKIFSK